MKRKSFILILLAPVLAWFIPRPEVKEIHFTDLYLEDADNAEKARIVIDKKIDNHNHMVVETFIEFDSNHEALRVWTEHFEQLALKEIREHYEH